MGSFKIVREVKKKNVKTMYSTAGNKITFKMLNTCFFYVHVIDQEEFDMPMTL